MADLKNQKIKDTYQSLLQTDASGNLQNLTGGTPTLIISGQTTLTGGVVSANPTPRIKFDDYYDNNGGPSVSHIDLYGGTYGFGITAFDLDYTSDKNHRFYANGQSTPGLTIDGDTKMVSINNAGTPAYNLDVTGDIRCTDDLFVDDFASLDSARIGATQTDPGTGNLYVEGNLTVNTNTLYVNSTGVGINTIDQDAILTVSGESGTTWTAWEDVDMTFLVLTNGVPFLTYSKTGITVPDPLQQEGTSVRVFVGGVYYYGTIASNGGGGYGFANGRGYFGLTWSQANITITSATENVISYGGVDAGQKIFKVYNGTNPAFQISGTSVMSGSTDLLDMFANSSVTNQDVYWSANTNGSISNSGLTGNVGIGTTVPNQKLTVSGTISGDSTMAATTYNSTTSSGGYKLNGDKYLWISSSDLQVGNVSADTDIIGTSINLQTATTINDNLTVTGNINISGTTTYGNLSDGTITATAFVDEDDMSSNSATLIPTQQSVKAYADTKLSSTANNYYPGGTMTGQLNHNGQNSINVDLNSGTIDNCVIGATTAVAATFTDLTASGNINISGTTSYIGAVSGTGSVTAIGGFVGDVTGNADTVTNGVYTSNNLSVMAATTSAQLKGVLSDETGTGSVVFATSPTLVTPVLGTPASGVLTNCTGYPEAALPSSINAIKIADGTVTSTEFQYINTLSSNVQTQINTVNSTRSHFVTTTCILKVYASNTWSGFNTSTGGLNTNGFWSLDTGETDIADAYTYYDTSKNSLFTTPYAGKIKRLLINGTSQTGAAVADTINIHLAKATLTDGSDRPNWSQVTATTKTLPGTAGTTSHKSKHYVWDIPIDMAVAQYDSFLLLFKNPNNQLTWLPINILIEFEYTIT